MASIFSQLAAKALQEANDREAKILSLLALVPVAEHFRIRCRCADLSTAQIFGVSRLVIVGENPESAINLMSRVPDRLVPHALFALVESSTDRESTGYDRGFPVFEASRGAKAGPGREKGSQIGKVHGQEPPGSIAGDLGGGLDGFGQDNRF